MSHLPNLCFIFLIVCGCDARTSLYVGGLFQLSNSWFSKYASGIATILEQAFLDIANNSSLLEDYKLILIVKDTQVNITFNLTSTNEICTCIHVSKPSTEMSFLEHTKVPYYHK